MFRKRWLRASNKTHHPKSINPAVLVIDDEVFRRQLPASRSAEEMAVHLLGQHRGAPWLDRYAEKTCTKLAGWRGTGSYDCYNSGERKRAKHVWVIKDITNLILLTQ